MHGSGRRRIYRHFTADWQTSGRGHILLRRSIVSEKLATRHILTQVTNRINRLCRSIKQILLSSSLCYGAIYSSTGQYFAQREQALTRYHITSSKYRVRSDSPPSMPRPRRHSVMSCRKKIRWTLNQSIIHLSNWMSAIEDEFGVVFGHFTRLPHGVDETATRRNLLNSLSWRV